MNSTLKKTCYFTTVISDKGNIKNDKVLQVLIKLHFTRSISKGYNEFVIDLSNTLGRNALLALLDIKDVFPYIDVNCSRLNTEIGSEELHVSNDIVKNSVVTEASKIILVATDLNNFPDSIIRHVKEHTIDLVILDYKKYDVFYY